MSETKKNELPPQEDMRTRIENFVRSQGGQVKEISVFPDELAPSHSAQIKKIPPGRKILKITLPADRITILATMPSQTNGGFDAEVYGGKYYVAGNHDCTLIDLQGLVQQARNINS